MIIVGETCSGTEDDDTNDADDDNSPYCEPGGTSWNEVYAQLTKRHAGGQVTVFGDGHAKWVKHDWFRTPTGKYAMCPFQANKADGTAW